MEGKKVVFIKGQNAEVDAMAAELHKQWGGMIDELEALEKQAKKSATRASRTCSWLR